MPETVKIAFQRRIISLPMRSILPLKKLAPEIKRSAKYKRIARSVEAVGIIEPLVIARSEARSEYLLLDGHVRFQILAETGSERVRCIVADDDETFTYNKRVNRLSTVQEHYMVVKALARGVSEEKLAGALNVDVNAIKRRRTLLNGICPEVVQMLDEKHVNQATFDVLKKMKPMRQMEVAELMAGAGNFSASYAKALLAATPQAALMRPDRPKKVGAMTVEQMARMEKEMEKLQEEMKSTELSSGDDSLDLVIIAAYLGKLVGNREVQKYLAKNHPEILSEFRAITTSVSLTQGVQAELAAS